MEKTEYNNQETSFREEIYYGSCGVDLHLDTYLVNIMPLQNPIKLKLLNPELPTCKL